MRLYWVGSFSEILEMKTGWYYLVGKVHKIAKFGLSNGQKFRVLPNQFLQDCIAPDILSTNGYSHIKNEF